MKKSVFQKKIPQRHRLSDDDKALMIQVLIRNQIAFGHAKNKLKDEHFSDMDSHLKAVWQAVCDYYNTYDNLPDLEFVQAETKRLIKEDPGLDPEDALDEVSEIILKAFDPEWGPDIKTKEEWAKWTLDTMQKYMEESLADRIQGEISRSKGSLIAENLPKVLENAYKEAAQIASINDTAVKSLGQEWDEHQARLKPFRGRSIIGLKTGLKELDHRTLGLRGTIVLGSKPGMGKTALCLEMALGVCRNFVENAAVVVYLSLDMDRFDLYRRIESNVAGIPWSVLMFGSPNMQYGESDDMFNLHDAELLAQGHERLKAEQIGKRMTVIDRTVVGDVITADRLTSILADCKSRCKAKRALLVVDYLQLLPVPDDVAKGGDLAADKYRIRFLQQAVERSRTAEDPIGDTVVIVSEARKPASSKECWGEAMSELMGSARTGYAADGVLLYRPMTSAELVHYYFGAPLDKKTAEKHRKALEKDGISPIMLILDKGRDGMTRGDWGLEFHFKVSKFREIEPGKGTHKAMHTADHHLKNLVAPEALKAADALEKAAFESEKSAGQPRCRPPASAPPKRRRNWHPSLARWPRSPRPARVPSRRPAPARPRRSREIRASRRRREIDDGRQSPSLRRCALNSGPVNKVPFFGRVPDLVMVDRAERYVRRPGPGRRSPFRGIGAWPMLEDVIKACSQEFLERHGKPAWETAGGIYGDDGKPTCRQTSSMAVEAVRRVADGAGGMLWQDQDGTLWAVRLARRNGPSYNGQPEPLFGFSISWQGSALLLDPHVRDQYEQAAKKAVSASVQTRLKTARQGLGAVGQRLRLYERAEQLLWAVHLAVTSQRSSTVLLPDVLLGQVIWGGDRAGWPKDWRGEILAGLKALTSLRSEILRLSPSEWRPRVGPIR